MSVARHSGAIRTYWHLPAVLSTLGALLLGVVVWQQKPLYRADEQLVVSFRSQGTPAGSPPGVVTADTPAERRLIESRLRTYTQRATSRATAQAVIASLHLPYKPDELARNITSITPLDTAFIDISVVDADPRRSVLICNAIAVELGRIATEENRSTATAPSLAISVDKAASVPTHAIPRYWQIQVIGGLVGGFIVGVGFAMLRFELDTRGQTVWGWLARRAGDLGAFVTSRSKFVGKRISARFWGPGWL